MSQGVAALTAFMGDSGEEDRFFREMMDALPVAVYVTDAEGRLTYFNRAAVQLSGRVPVLGTDRWCVTWKLFSSDGAPLPHDQCPMAVALKGGEAPLDIECIAERPDGTRFWFTPRLAVRRDAQGRITAGINLLFDITARKNAEIEAAEHFRAIVETTPECVQLVAPDGTLLFMNTPGLAMFDASSPQALIGKKIYNLIAAEDRDRYRHFNERICAGEKGALEFDVVGLHGRRSRMETHAAPLRQAGGVTVQLGITRNITERKRNERAVQLLSAIVDSSNDAIISKDLNGTITSWNKSAERLFGYTAPEAVGQSITMLIPPDRQNEEPDILAHLRRGERIQQFETVRRRKDGVLLDVALTISPVKDSEGNVVGASKVARDITESKRSEAALLASEARFRQLADAMPQIVWTARGDGTRDYYNERWYQFSGFSPDMPGDASWLHILHPDDIERSVESWKSAVQSGSAFNIEYRLWDRREHRWRWFVDRALPVRDAGGNIVKWFGSSIDIDDQKAH